MEPRVQTIRFIEIDSLSNASLEMERVGVDPAGIKLMAPKELYRNLKLTALSTGAGNIIKQDMLAVGGEAAVSKGVVSAEVDYTDCILSGTLKQFRRLVKKLSIQPYGLSDTAKAIACALDNLEIESYRLSGVSRSWTLGRSSDARPLVVGILNVTPDSFSDGGRYKDADEAVKFGLNMCEEGADIIDVGGESTRPGAEPISLEEELRRVLPVIEGLIEGGAAVSGVAVSIDTTKAEVARRALALGAEMVNDVSAMGQDSEMAGVVAESGAAVVLMHMRGTSQTMQADIDYEDLMGEIYGYLNERVEFAVSKGISRDKIVIDPGIGFGKSREANLEIIRRLGEFKTLGLPIMLGASRKSFMEDVSLGDEVEDRLIPSVATAVAGLMNGATLLRVHDVSETRAAIDMASAIKNPEGVS